MRKMSTAVTSKIVMAYLFS